MVRMLSRRLTYFLLLCAMQVTAQTLSIKPKKPIICYQGDRDVIDHIHPPKEFSKWKERRAGRLKTASFEVEYIDFPADNLAKNAFQFAVDIWETQLVSPV